MQKCQKRLEDTEALSTRTMKKVEREADTNSRSSTADKRKRKGKQGNLGGCRKSERETAGSCRDCKKA